MAAEQNAPQEQVIREWPKYSLWLEDNATHQGNLILTDRQLVFLREQELSDEEIMKYNSIVENGGGVTEELRFAVSMQKKNWSLPLGQLVNARISIFQWLPFRLWLEVDHVTASKKARTFYFVFTMGRFKRMLMKEFPTLGWRYTIKDEIKHYRKQQAKVF
jgi:hypothetical protein